MKVSQGELNAMALNTGHKFQKARIIQLLKFGWRAYSIRSRSAYGSVVFISISGIGGNKSAIVYPNGLMIPFKKNQKRMEYTWDDVKKYAEASEPTAGLVLDNIA